MKHRIMGKLRSRRGASITFALLLFLVCTVLCSVLVTAATAASGRMSRIAENDQRYYSVMSAAELMKDLIDGQPVSVVEVIGRTGTTVYTNGEAEETNYDDDAATTKYFLVNKPASEIREDDIALRRDGVKEMIRGAEMFSSIAEDAAYEAFRSAKSSPSASIASKELSLTSSDTLKSALGVTADPLKVKITETPKVEPNGAWTLTLTISSDNGAAIASSMMMIFEADRSEAVSSKTVDGIPTGVNTAADGTVTYTVSSTETTTKITTVVWKLSEIKTL